MDKQEYYDNKYPKADISYRRVETDGKYLIDVRQFVNPHNHRLPEIFGIGDEPEWEDDIAFNGLIWVIDNVTYTPDKIAYRYDEYWAMPWQTHERKRGDCEDGACLLYSILSKNGVRPWKMRVSAGNVVMPNGKKAGHAYLNYYHEASDSWKVLDWCFAQTRDKLEKRVDYREDKRYDEVWFSFNELNSWSKGLNSDAQEFLGGKHA
jgi:hypothetical protein